MYSAVHNIDCLCSYWHSDPESDNSDSSDSDFEPEKEVIQNYIYMSFSFHTLYEFQFSDWLICTRWYRVVTEQPPWRHYRGVIAVM